MWSLEPDDDTGDFVVGPDAWGAEERFDRETLAKEVSTYVIRTFAPAASFKACPAAGD